MHSIYSTLKNLKEEDTSDQMSSLGFKSKESLMDPKIGKFETLLDNIDSDGPSISTLLTPTGKGMRLKTQSQGGINIIIQPTSTELEGSINTGLKSKSSDQSNQSIKFIINILIL